MDTSADAITESTKGGLCDPLGRQYVTDTQTGTVGLFMAKQAATTTATARVFVRPIHGGPEWELSPARLRLATRAEIEAAR